jgi:glutamate racemase
VVIGVFDSGRGGEVLAGELAAELTDQDVIVELDVDNVPYGLKTSEEIYALTSAGLKKLVDRGADVIVLACNTASTIVHRLREDFDQPIIALEPMIKPAIEATKSGVIAVLATPATLASPKYQELKRAYASDCNVLEPDCGSWSAMIQGNQIDYYRIDATVADVLSKGADVLVLGCTHYHELEDHLVELVGGSAVVMQPSEAILSQLRRLI